MTSSAGSMFLVAAIPEPGCLSNPELDPDPNWSGSATTVEETIQFIRNSACKTSALLLYTPPRLVFLLGQFSSVVTEWVRSRRVFSLTYLFVCERENAGYAKSLSRYSILEIDQISNWLDIRRIPNIKTLDIRPKIWHYIFIGFFCPFCTLWIVPVEQKN